MSKPASATTWVGCDVDRRRPAVVRDRRGGWPDRRDRLWWNTFRHGPDLRRAARLRKHCPGAAHRLGTTAIGLSTWQATDFPRADGTITVTALPAVHGPLDGTRDASGHVNAEVTGFLLRADGLPTVYVSGDNASIVPVEQIARRFPDIDIAVLFAGASRLATKNQGRPLTLTGPRAADVAAVSNAGQVVIAHIAGWSIYSETIDDVRTAFDEAGIADRLVAAMDGHWAPLIVPAS